ncbi:nucleoside hydrolase [Marinicella meishanensis]|uniref:nucleoside hydrolase n=1 Tax=Marinicella meishanensis TaxID=2873263 RepID=UPI001CBDA8CC|nr:nucleoside hydrolase [Marinicella sp. NBU2979]
MEKILFNHDAAIDEFMAAVLLTTMADKTFLGSVIMNADCIDRYAMQAQYKIQQYIGQSQYPLTLSGARQWNPFPWVYREDCIKEGQIEVLSDLPDNPQWPPFPDGDAFMTEVLQQALAAGETITLLVNCPMTTLHNVLQAKPDLAGAIERLIWMGGAIDVPGNLDPNTIPPQMANKRAEWNAFCDPFAVDWVFNNTTFPIYMFPLDVTDQAAITDEFMTQLKIQAPEFAYSKLAYQSYELVAAESFYDMWDVVTTCFIPHPEFFATPEVMNLSIVTDGFMQGTIETTAGGRPVNVLLNLVQKQAFYQFVLQQFRR